MNKTYMTIALTVVAIPPIAGKSLPLLCNRKPAYTALAQWP